MLYILDKCTVTRCSQIIDTVSRYILLDLLVNGSEECVVYTDIPDEESCVRSKYSKLLKSNSCFYLNLKNICKEFNQLTIIQS